MVQKREAKAKQKESSGLSQKKDVDSSLQMFDDVVVVKQNPKTKNIQYPTERKRS